MQKIFIFIAVLIFSLSSIAQKPYTIKAGTNINDILSFKDLYLYPDFVSGTAFFKDGSKYRNKMNYNLLTGTMQFIDTKGDTLSVANEHTIKYMIVGEDTFYFNSGYLRLLSGNSGIKLADQHFYKLVNKQRIGAYGLPTEGTIESLGDIVYGSQQNKLIVQEDITIAKEAMFYLGDSNDQFVPFNKKNVLKTFASHQKMIEDYLNRNSINYSKKEDLLKLTFFLQQLKH